MEAKPVPSCALDAGGLDRQRERYRRLSGSVVSVERAGHLLTARFGADLDRALLDEAIAIERECCPFFRIGFDEAERRLEVGVSDPALEDALDALAHGLGAGA